ncbi:MAG: hypothetical protein MUC96_12055 [Myxococcaceae bacterium]|jgi:hypothetical protein|nr:hypothetical protein [Myxococcaceae bacterium]
MADLLPLPLYRRAAEAALATLKRSPWIVVVPTMALGLGTLADWLLAPLRNTGLIIAAPVKALLWSVALYVWKRVLLEGEVDRADVEADLAARAKSLPSLGLPLLFGTVAFLTLTYGGALASLFVMALVLLPGLELALLGSKRPLARFFHEHGAAWAASQFVFVSVSLAGWLVLVMVASLVHVFAGEVASALVGGPLVTALWLVRGHAWFALDVEPAAAAPLPAGAAPAKPVKPTTARAGPKSPARPGAPRPPAPRKPPGS